MKIKCKFKTYKSIFLNYFYLEEEKNNNYYLISEVILELLGDVKEEKKSMSVPSLPIKYF